MVIAILDSIDEAIHIVNAEGITIFYNQIAAEHDGLQKEEVLGKHILEVFPSLSESTSTLLKVIKTKQPIFNLPQTYKNNHGKPIDTINTTLPIKVNNQLIGAVEIGKDYTKIKALSNKLTDLQSRAKGIMKKPNEVIGAIYTFKDILTKNKAFEKVKYQAEKVANSSSTVLIFGETGTGKELLVQSIHNASIRNKAPFIAQNCGAIPESLLESILFGTVKGSYTGAVDRAGLFEIAHGGTLFLDEINSMPLELQSRLLRVLEDGMVRRIGGAKAFQVDVRVIVALNKKPILCLEDQELRPDLYYRLNVFSLEIPPLRDRKEDIPHLIDHFIRKFNQSLQKEVAQIDTEVIKCLSAYSWPGNVRELMHIIEHSMNIVEDKILKIEHLPSQIFGNTLLKKNETIKPLRVAVKETEIMLIESALQQSDGNIQQAALLLKIPRQTLQYKIQKYKLKVNF
ncbi:sigma-54 interaction domain-containing protein [Ferdinandcohnia quinoae]|uniref:Sigma 54-interacting transcriptional regulator n=1 Tax=Fredinandcohnia quinoae TaxID=2918902 RepID=A0AAW5E163_9BACI|nr:sigma 54-interacting transcriptional regulator [Fredinandcohnia sp. SECRCQ15]MCH1626348.1 sigma 54-interacting transcriptional regulator [Fredinandcohnia sp. SECRCQ15]